MADSTQRLAGMSYSDKLAFFCKARAGAKRYCLGPETAFSERWRPALSGILVRPSGMPEGGYRERADAVEAAKAFRQCCRQAA